MEWKMNEMLFEVSPLTPHSIKASHLSTAIIIVSMLAQMMQKITLASDHKKPRPSPDELFTRWFLQHNPSVLKSRCCFRVEYSMKHSVPPFFCIPSTSWVDSNIYFKHILFRSKVAKSNAFSEIVHISYERMHTHHPLSGINIIFWIWI